MRCGGTTAPAPCLQKEGGSDRQVGTMPSTLNGSERKGVMCRYQVGENQSATGLEVAVIWEEGLISGLSLDMLLKKLQSAEMAWMCD